MSKSQKTAGLVSTWSKVCKLHGWSRTSAISAYQTWHNVWRGDIPETNIRRYHYKYSQTALESLFPTHPRSGASAKCNRFVCMHLWTNDICNYNSLFQSQLCSAALLRMELMLRSRVHSHSCTLSHIYIHSHNLYLTRLTFHIYIIIYI